MRIPGLRLELSLLLALVPTGNVPAVISQPRRDTKSFIVSMYSEGAEPSPPPAAAHSFLGNGLDVIRWRIRPWKMVPSRAASART